MADASGKKRTRIDYPQNAPNSDADLGGLIGSMGIPYGDPTESIKIPKGVDPALMGKGTHGARSVFNDYHIISINKGNYPIQDTDYDKLKDLNAYNALDLINNPKGASIFMPRDFMLCARYGLPINRMITLRRFPYPVSDNIFEITKSEAVGATEQVSGGATEPDIGRMITYMDQETNKLSEFLKFSYSLSWRELNATTEDASGGMNGDHAGVSGWMKSMAALMDDGTIGRNAVQGENLLNMNPLNDQNKVHGPVDSIASTWIRDVGIKNDISFQITFDYELRSINGMNPKTLFLDLLSNILAVTFNNARFWGGARIWTGPRPSNWMRKMAFMNPKNAEDFLQKGRVAFKESLKPFAKDAAGSAIAILKNIVMNGINLALGKILDKVGRPSTIVMNSLLNGDPTGEWHLTIGNPLNPIISMGNLILENTELSFGDTLGYDDFPTTIKVICTLKPGQPRDKAGLESIFNRGLGRTYWPPTEFIQRTNELVINSTDKTQSSAGYIKYGMGEYKMKNFGEFDAASVGRSAEMQVEYLRSDPTSSDKPSVTTEDLETYVSLNKATTSQKDILGNEQMEKWQESEYLPKPETNKDMQNKKEKS